MKTALIGYTGFVGSNINFQANFDELYNSKNLGDITGKSFDLVVCAGVPAVKWWANQNPDKDLETILALAEVYKTISAKRFVLISTVDVYPSPIDVTEKSIINAEDLCPYGKNRLLLEDLISNHFDSYNIIRLPGLFGKGIKKNVLFDLIQRNILEKINLDSEFQWYPLSRLWKDIQTVINADIRIANLAVQPLSTRRIRDTYFTNLDVGSDPFPKAKYDMKSDYAALFTSKCQNYIMTNDEVLLELGDWLKKPEVKCE
ncbi:NAD-dependent epimerase/dehydratase family protein [Alteromonas confluentis]|uniref:NAD-dependent epimerase/dehydratase domain-containing protein n=1 Tax=Alteromonas confluentis TaxID=1656094 RepID=A0A1E7Z9A3_9ALTE|nr:NAD-dependent epimerase/dehydratase family protein [Alteromonas confluentis]OFC70105.1 hypothetical protein BFC18_12995 [Alteromonas confluentis]